MKRNRLNIVRMLQAWMDSVAGQTFLNYAYSWGAAVVITGTLFKLTHLPYADLMLYIGMGTEIVVFFFSAFDRPFDKTQEGFDLSSGFFRRSGKNNMTTKRTAQEDGYGEKLAEMDDMLSKEKKAVERMVRETDNCTAHMVSLSENIKRIDSVVAAVADALRKRD